MTFVLTYQMHDLVTVTVQYREARTVQRQFLHIQICPLANTHIHV